MCRLKVVLCLSPKFFSPVSSVFFCLLLKCYQKIVIFWLQNLVRRYWIVVITFFNIDISLSFFDNRYEVTRSAIWSYTTPLEIIFNFRVVFWWKYYHVTYFHSLNSVLGDNSREFSMFTAISFNFLLAEERGAIIKTSRDNSMLL